MRMKRIKCKIKPFKGVRAVYCGEHGIDEGAEQLVVLLQSMGYIVYEMPLSECQLLVSDRTLTYGDLRKSAKAFDVDIDWWDNDTNFNEMANKELDEVTL